jgi:hypothetical protein
MNSNEEMLQIAIAQVATGNAKLGPAIDKLTSSNLKRVLKAITFVRLSDEILGKQSDPLSEQEQVLIDAIMTHQENVMGYLQLNDEVNGEEEVEQSEETIEGENNELD